MLLDVTDLTTGYGDLPVLRNVDLTVDSGEVVTIVGANGAGKSTLLQAITGLLPAWSGSVHFDGADITKGAAHNIAKQGLVMVPEGRRLFPFLTVEENLLVGAVARKDKQTTQEALSEVYEHFPRLAERTAQSAGSLSGGEQQMCAIGRALMSDPRLLILDEPSLGLAPIIVDQVFTLIETLASTGLTILLVEQNVQDALQMATRGYVLELGEVAMSGAGPELLDRPELKRAYLGI